MSILGIDGTTLNNVLNITQLLAIVIGLVLTAVKVGNRVKHYFSVVDVKIEALCNRADKQDNCNKRLESSIDRIERNSELAHGQINSQLKAFHDKQDEQGERIANIEGAVDSMRKKTKRAK